MKILSKQDFNQNESKNFVVDNLSSAPSNPVLGQIYYNTQEERAYICIKAGETPEWADLTFSDYDSLPIGSMIPYSSTTIPSSWLECNGQAVSRTVYEGLFNVIGTTYGYGDGSTTFNVPNRKGKVGVGLDTTDTDFNTLGKTGGSKYMQSHTHTFQTNRPAGNSTLWSIPQNINLQGGNAVLSDYPYQTDNPVTLKSTGAGDSENIQPYIVDTYIIKATNNFSYIDVTQAHVINNLTNTSITDALSANMGKELNERFTYSTEEKVIGTWIDGKPLYRKVFEYTLGNIINSWKTIGTIPNINFSVRMYGIFYSGKEKYPMPRSYNNEEITLYCDTSSKLFREQHNYTYANNLPSYVIIEYTKTTD